MQQAAQCNFQSMRVGVREQNQMQNDKQAFLLPLIFFPTYSSGPGLVGSFQAPWLMIMGARQRGLILPLTLPRLVHTSWGAHSFQQASPLLALPCLCLPPLKMSLVKPSLDRNIRASSKIIYHGISTCIASLEEFQGEVQIYRINQDLCLPIYKIVKQLGQ